MVGGVLLVVGAIAAGGGIIYILVHYGRGLPDFEQLAEYEPPVITRVHAGDGTLLKEYARQKRLFVPINSIPKDLINAFLSAEDRKFYEHSGVDYVGILRAALTNAKNSFSNRRKVGGSTITQQVVKNFLVTNEVSYERKIKEAILAYRMERAFSKDQILELYMNDSYLGNGAYGVAAGALIYFDKPLDEMSLGEMAYLAAVLKFPSNRNPERRLGRRNWILGRMADLGHISEEAAKSERAMPVELRRRQFASQVYRADHFVEEIRREIYDLYGGTRLYEGGLSVRTTLEPRLQGIAEKSLRDGLVAYDRRHGWRGPIAKLSLAGDWADDLGAIEAPLGVDDWRLALVLELTETGAVIGFEDQSLGFIHFDDAKWARHWREGEKLGPKLKDIGGVLAAGDVIPVESLNAAEKVAVLSGYVDENGVLLGPVPAYGLRQIPDVEGALVAMDPHTGRVLAMVGGWDFAESEFNRATQAERQPGSAFKPFVYATALDQGFTPSSLILDAPFVMDQGDGQGMWKPGNSSDKFYGPSTLRLGLEKSRNLMTVRLAQYIGMEHVVDYAKRFGIGKNMKPNLAMSLGAAEVSLLNLTSAYAMLVNGGNRVTPTMVDRIQDRRGATVFKHDQRLCVGCGANDGSEGPLKTPEVPDIRERVLDERTAYQVVAMLQGVVQRGTGRQIRTLGKPLAGKTGTTNDWVDAWFVGFSPDLVVGVFVGFDRPRSLGNGEEGSLAAAPVFKQFMAAALKDQTPPPFRIPSGIRLVRVDAETGQPAQPGTRRVILEAFLPGSEPDGTLLVLDGANGFMQTDGKLRKGTGGLY